MKNVNRSIELLNFEELKVYYEKVMFFVDKSYVIGYDVRDLEKLLYRKVL